VRAASQMKTSRIARSVFAGVLFATVLTGYLRAAADRVKWRADPMRRLPRTQN